MKPSKGRIVFVRNASGDNPAIVTKVWGDDELINARVFTDSPDIPTHATSLPLIDPEGETPLGWYWPPKV